MKDMLCAFNDSYEVPTCTTENYRLLARVRLLALICQLLLSTSCLVRAFKLIVMNYGLCTVNKN